MNDTSFKMNTPIYLQIVAVMLHRITTRQWKDGERIPSIRDLAIEFGVNPNTCMRAYEILTDNGVISMQRGIGYSVCEGGYNDALKIRRDEFLKHTLPEVFKQMRALNISVDQVVELYKSQHKE